MTAPQKTKYKGFLKLKSTDQIMWVFFDVLPTGLETFWQFQEIDRDGLKNRWVAVSEVVLFEYWEL